MRYHLEIVEFIHVRQHVQLWENGCTCHLTDCVVCRTVSQVFTCVLVICILTCCGVNVCTVQKEAGIAQLVECPTEKPGAILTWVRVPSAAGDVCSQSQLPVQTLLVLRCPYSPCVTSPASTSVRTLKIPNAGSHNS